MWYNTPIKSDDVFARAASGIASIETPITPDAPGRVSFQGTTWFAKFIDTACQQPGSPGQSVLVVERRGLTLLVEPLNKA